MPNDLRERIMNALSLVLTLVALFVVGPIAASVVARVRGPGGGSDATLLVSDAPLTGVLAGVVTALGALLLGVTKSRFFGWHRGYTVAGLVFAWSAFRTGDARVLYMSLPESASPVLPLLAESVLAGSAAMIVAHFSVWMSGPSGQQPAAEEARDRSCLFKASGLASIGASAVVMFVLTWVLVQTPLRGQAVVGTAIAAIGASAVGVLVSRQMGGNTGIIAPLLGIFLFGLIGPVGALVLGGDASGAARANDLLPFAYIQPLDWAGAMLLGTPIGVGWAAGSLEQHEDKPEPRGSARSSARSGADRTRRRPAAVRTRPAG